MSFEEQNLAAFVQLLQEQPQLFTDPKRQELLKLIEPLADDTETLSSAISMWYEQYNNIVNSQFQILNNYIYSQQSEPGDQRLAGTTSFSSTPSQPRITKELLKNSIVQSQPTKQTPPKKSSTDN
ncbi:hypothetical protein H4N54_25445 [Limnospira fusiformis KN01]|uniref:hypothetical protein n=1 Tax=Limnospira TaxID=2596745 RepID=UPI001658BAA7|nr:MULTISPECIES: hypothetical protein [Limnospira]MDT9198579.1 hypothetical protein [Limnospira sp. PMC 1042.18]MDT9234039.1 hypothetical protein [Limnospira sp. PMC 917.15]ULB45684.1 hypothetical protein H4N54_25445 [Limnospira fusiformis KN01]